MIWISKYSDIILTWFINTQEIFCQNVFVFFEVAPCVYVERNVKKQQARISYNCTFCDVECHYQYVTLPYNPYMRCICMDCWPVKDMIIRTRLLEPNICETSVYSFTKYMYMCICIYKSIELSRVLFLSIFLQCEAFAFICCKKDN